MKLLKKNIRVHKSYVVPQGACSDGKYIYCVYEKAHKKHIIVVYDKKGRQLRKSKPLVIGHGNDLTYYEGNLYVTHSARDDVIHVVSAESLKKVKDIKTKWNNKRGFNGITRTSDGFALRTIKGNRLVLVDHKFAKLKEYKFGKGYGTSQGMDYHDGKLYRGFSKLQTKGANHIGIYNMKGENVGHKHVKYRGELESMFWIGKTLYGIIFRKKKNEKGKKSYSSKLFKV